MADIIDSKTSTLSQDCFAIMHSSKSEGFATGLVVLIVLPIIIDLEADVTAEAIMVFSTTGRS